MDIKGSVRLHRGKVNWRWHESGVREFAAFACLLAGGCAHHKQQPSGNAGLCATGRAQSPIAIDGLMVMPQSHRLEMSYKPVASVRCRAGTRGLGARMEDAGSAQFDGRAYALQMIEVIAPSEHVLGVTRFVAEARLVHKDPSGQTLIVVVLLRSEHAAEDNPMLDSLLACNAGGTGAAGNPARLLPVLDDRYFVYSGSLTQPPCSENVHWLVMKDKLAIAEVQASRIAESASVSARAVQPLNERVVGESGPIE